jgi:hypothetical protein
MLEVNESGLDVGCHQLHAGPVANIRAFESSHQLAFDMRKPTHFEIRLARPKAAAAASPPINAV